MSETTLIATEHKDIIHDVSFDYYGKRMATCSSDHTVKIWDLNDKGNWKCTADWRPHTGSVWKVTWANPEFGQVIATCSFDRTVVVWEEQIVENTTQHSSSKNQWVPRASLVDSSYSVTDLKFAPKHLGLRLAMCYKDGGVFRIYEALDIMNLSQWSVQHVVNCKLQSTSCISWNPSRSCNPMLAIGSDDPSTDTGGKVEIHELNRSSRKSVKVATLMVVTGAVHDVSFASNVGRSQHLLAIASRDIYIFAVKPPKDRGADLPQEKHEINILATLQDHKSEVWKVEWNLTGSILASTGNDGHVRLWKRNYMNTWRCISEWKGDGKAVITSSDKTVPNSSINLLPQRNFLMHQ